jgi:hypothetical protein
MNHCPLGVGGRVARNRSNCLLKQEHRCLTAHVFVKQNVPKETGSQIITAVQAYSLLQWFPTCGTRTPGGMRQAG